MLLVDGDKFSKFENKNPTFFKNFLARICLDALPFHDRFATKRRTKMTRRYSCFQRECPDTQTLMVEMAMEERNNGNQATFRFVDRPVFILVAREQKQQRLLTNGSDFSRPLAGSFLAISFRKLSILFPLLAIVFPKIVTSNPFSVKAPVVIQSSIRAYGSIFEDSYCVLNSKTQW